MPASVDPLEGGLSLGQPRLGNLDGKRGYHSGFLFPPHAGKMVLRDDTAGTELPFATPRGPRDCPLGEETVALAASVSWAFLNEPPGWIQPLGPPICLQADSGRLASVA